MVRVVVQDGYSWVLNPTPSPSLEREGDLIVMSSCDYLNHK